jgi:hypothetical protein
MSGVLHISGETDWAQVAIDIPAGRHALAWTYAKDAVGGAGDDAGWVDQVSIPAGIDGDGDGMADAWEDARFGTLERDGSGDFDGDGTSDLDDYLAARSTRLDLPAGLATLSLPYLPAAGIETCLELLETLGADPDDRLLRLDTPSRRYRECSAGTGNDFLLRPGVGYAVELTHPASLQLEGEPITVPVELAPGLNLVGADPALVGRRCDDWLERIAAGDGTAVRRLGPDDARFETCLWSGDEAAASIIGKAFRLERGAGYWIEPRFEDEVVLGIEQVGHSVIHRRDAALRSRRHQGR